MSVEKINFDDEVELKKFLAARKIMYGEIGCNKLFIITFRDNKAGTPLSRGVYDSPISAIRFLSVLIPQVKLPIEDVDIQLELVYDPTTSEPAIRFTDYITLSPYLYYKKKDLEKSVGVKTEEKTEN